MNTIQIDKAVLKSLYGDCQESVNEVFSEFLLIHDEIKQNLVSSYESRQFDSLGKFLHYYGPSFMYVGMPDVSGFFKKLEQKCKNVSDHNSMGSDFSCLIQTIDESRAQVIIEMNHFNTA